MCTCLVTAVSIVIVYLFSIQLMYIVQFFFFFFFSKAVSFTRLVNTLVFNTVNLRHRSFLNEVSNPFGSFNRLMWSNPQEVVCQYISYCSLSGDECCPFSRSIPPHFTPSLRSRHRHFEWDKRWCMFRFLYSYVVQIQPF